MKAKHNSTYWKSHRTSIVGGMLALLCASSNITGNAAEPKVKVDDNSFKCITSMTPVRHFYVDNLLGKLDATAAVTKAGMGDYAEGSVLQWMPNEVMIKQQKGFSPATRGWEFFWIDIQFEKQGFLPSSPFLGALAYIRERRAGLSVYLDDPDVAIDTNHLERALRVMPMGKKNWLFCWPALGAKHVRIVQSLLATCRLHDINPYDYLVDVLQRVGQHPASLVHQLTPRLWKQLFSANPLRSDLHDLRGSCT